MTLCEYDFQPDIGGQVGMKHIYGIIVARRKGKPGKGDKVS